MSNEKTDINARLKETFYKAVGDVFKSAEVEMIVASRPSNAFESMQAAQAMAFTGNIVESCNEVTFQFNEAQDYDAMQALQQAASKASGIHVSYSTSDITFHAKPETVEARLNATRFERLLQANAPKA